MSLATRGFLRRAGANHGLSERPEYHVWASMMRRCHDPKGHAFERYGGRGIRVAPEWHDPQVFLDAVGPRPSPRHSLERIDNNRGYEPGNVKWDTPKAQARNRRNNLLITARGRTQCLAAWSEETGLAWSTIYNRLLRGWSGEKAVSVPAVMGRNKWSS